MRKKNTDHQWSDHQFQEIIFEKTENPKQKGNTTKEKAEHNQIGNKCRIGETNKPKNSISRRMKSEIPTKTDLKKDEEEANYQYE